MAAPAHAPARPEAQEQAPTPALNLAQALLLVALGVGVEGMGAFYRQDQLVSGGLLALAAVVAVVSSHRRQLFSLGLARPVVVVTAALAAFGAWAVTRGAMAGDAASGLSVLALAVALAVGFALGHLASVRQRRALQHAVVAVGVASALSGWIGYVWRIESLALPSGEVWRAAGTLTYENALACLVVAAAMVATAGLVERETPLGSIALCLLLLGGAATQSRGGAVALIAGIAALGAGVGWRALARAALRPAIGATVAAAALVPSAAIAARARPDLALAGLAVGLGIAVWPRRFVPVRVLAAAGALVLLVGLGGAAFITQQADVSVLSGRFSLSSTHRVSQHRAALELLAAEPVIGTGPGEAELRWRDRRGRALVGRFIHNEYLQVTVELGLVGGALLLMVLAGIARAVWLGRADGGTRWAGVVAALVVIAVHGGLDFVWHLPVIPVVAALLGGTATAVRR
jgi:hypothetical protein